MINSELNVLDAEIKLAGGEGPKFGFLIFIAIAVVFMVWTSQTCRIIFDHL